MKFEELNFVHAEKIFKLILNQKGLDGTQVDHLDGIFLSSEEKLLLIKLNMDHLEEAKRISNDIIPLSNSFQTHFRAGILFYQKEVLNMP